MHRKKTNSLLSYILRDLEIKLRLNVEEFTWKEKISYLVVV